MKYKIKKTPNYLELHMHLQIPTRNRLQGYSFIFFRTDILQDNANVAYLNASK